MVTPPSLVRAENGVVRKKPIVAAVVGVDGCGKSSTFAGTLSTLADRVRVVTASDWEIYGGGRMISFGLANGTEYAVPLDPTNSIHPQVRVSFTHYMIHHGDSYTTHHKTPDGAGIADNGTFDVAVDCGTNHHLHAQAFTSVEGAADAYIYENPVYSGGTALSVLNRNRSSSNESDATVVHTPVVTSAGTCLECSYQPGGRGPLSPGAASAERDEWVLAAGKKYLYRLINRGGAEKQMGLSLAWYEEDA